MTQKEKTLVKTIAGVLLGLPTGAAIVFFLLNAAFASDGELKAVSDSVAAVRTVNGDLRHDMTDLRREVAETKKATCAGLSPEQKAVAAVCP